MLFDNHVLEIMFYFRLAATWCYVFKTMNLHNRYYLAPPSGITEQCNSISAFLSLAQISKARLKLGIQDLVENTL